jgi:hypothetical protein
MEPRSTISRDHPQEEHFRIQQLLLPIPHKLWTWPLFPIDNHTAYQLSLLTKGIQNFTFLTEDQPASHRHDVSLADQTSSPPHAQGQGHTDPESRRAALSPHGRCSWSTGDTQCTAAEALSTP